MTYDKTYGHAAYGCEGCCGDNSPNLWYDPLQLILDGGLQDGVDAYDPCTEEIEDVSDAFAGNWSSGNTTIATVDSNGYHTGMGVGSTTSGTIGLLQRFNVRQHCPIAEFYPSGGVNVKPTITSVDPDTWDVGTTISSVTISGAGFGSAPTVNLPLGVTVSGGQASTDSRIVLSGVVVATSAQIGPSSLTVTATLNGEAQGTSDPSPILLDGPFYLTVQGDQLGKCSGCSTTVARFVTYQVTFFSGVPAGTTAVGENPVLSNWNCNQSEPNPMSAPCSEGFMTTSNGEFTDEWSLGGDGYTPAGCGCNVDDHWKWCVTGNSIGHLNGYIHTDAISINGVVNSPQPVHPRDDHQPIGANR